MKTRKINLWLMITAISFSFFIACKSKTESSTAANDSTVNTTATPATTTPAPSTNADTTTMNQPASTSQSQATTTGSTTKSTNKTGATHKRTGKTKVGAMVENKSSKMEPNSEGVYEFSEVRPAYPGGQQALENYITNNVEYPDAALNNATQGTVEVQFTVDEKGKIKDVHTIGSKVGDGLDEEAVRVVSAMPKWTAGTVKNKAVKSKVTIPITFKVEE